MARTPEELCKTEGDLLNRIVDLEKLVRDLLDAHQTGNLEMSSPEIGGHDDIPPHPWHAEWMHRAEQLLGERCAP